VAARLVPSEVIYRRKMGFGVPIGNWFRGEMKDFVKDILLSEKCLQRNIIKPEFIEKYVREHTNSEKDHTFQIWTLLMLEMWFQKFID
jgi:asparagine synthase (glutamine-hydrolysing)